MRVEDHRDEDDGVAEKDGDHRLPPVHARLDETAGKSVRGDHDAHADPQGCNVPCGPGAFLDRGRRQIVIPEWALGNVAVEFDKIPAQANVPRFRNRPSPAFPLKVPFSTMTLPRESTVSVTPRTLRPSYAL